jgi:hypothetical protein
VNATLALEAAASSLSDLLPFDVVGQVIPTAFNFDLRRWWATGEITGQS